MAEGDTPSFSVGIPDEYKKVLDDNMDIVKEQFLSKKESNSTELHSNETQKLLHFLSVIHDAFSYSKTSQQSTVHSSVVENSPVIQDCIAIFREIFRQHFRGVHYLTLVKFKEVSNKAESEASSHFKTLTLAKSREDYTNEARQLLRLMSLERQWLGRVNGHRRKVDIETVKAEVEEKFRVKIKAELPRLFEQQDDKVNNTNEWCLDPFEFNKKLHMLANLLQQQFKEQIPFHEQEGAWEISYLCSELKGNLESGVIKELKSKYRNRLEAIKLEMNRLAEKGVEEYAAAMSKCLGGRQTLLDMKKIFGEHRQALEKFAPQLETGSDNQVAKEYQVYCWNRYSFKAFEQFSKMIHDSTRNADKNAESCEQESKAEIEDALKKVSETFGRYDLSDFASEFSQHVLGGINSLISHIKDANKVVVESLVQNAKPLRIAVNAENTIIENCKEAYVEKLVLHLRQSKEFTEDVNDQLLKLLDRCHLLARTHAELKFRNFAPYLLDLDYEPELFKRLNKFEESFLAHLKANTKFFVDTVRIQKDIIIGTPIPFKAVSGSDASMKNGVTSSVQTHYQCITAMQVYENKSLEELQFEDRTKKSAVPLPSLNFPITVPDDLINLSEKFEKGFHVTSGGKRNDLESLDTALNINFSQSEKPPCSLSPEQLFTITSPSTSSPSTSSCPRRRAIRRFHR